MRKIKFRAWDRHEKRMVEADELVFWAGCCYRNPTKSLNDPNKPYAPAKLRGYSILEEYVMQYTGLKDINGKEIYEGDILETRDGRLHIVIYKDEGFITEYRYNLRGFEETIDIPLRNISKRSEVIGNIYDHSELLERE